MSNGNNSNSPSAVDKIIDYLTGTAGYAFKEVTEGTDQWQWQRGKETSPVFESGAAALKNAMVHEQDRIANLDKNGYSVIEECYHCTNQRAVPGDCHIACSRPDPSMRGVPHGESNGWFFYPINFDPAWKARRCLTFIQA